MSSTSTGRGLDLTVNGTVHRFAEDEAAEPLVNFLRDRLGHTDVKLACGEGACSACSVLVDGQSIPSCSVLLGRLRGRVVRTPADLADDPIGEVIAGALVNHGGMQCGFCTPGVLCSIYGLALSRAARSVRHDGDAARVVMQEELIAELGGHICRCTGYRGIIEAARTALETLTDGALAAWAAEA